MSSHYEVFANCPESGKSIRTGYKVDGPEFKEGEKPFGSYNCPVCNNVHMWSHDDEGIKINLVAE